MKFYTRVNSNESDFNNMTKSQKQYWGKKQITKWLIEYDITSVKSKNRK